MALPTWPDKDPNEVLDYIIDWTSALVGTDTITASTWTVPTGLTTTKNSFTDDLTVVWLSGGTENQKYTISNSVTTQDGRVMDRSVVLKIKSK